YPKLNYLFCHDCFTAIPLSGSGTEADPYQIQSAADFVALGEYCGAWDKYIVLMADIDLNGYVIRPIGNSMVRFTGNFNGQGFVIRNAKMNMPNKNYVGLFGSVGKGGAISDLGVEDVNIAGKKFVGGLIGFNRGAISNCYSTGFAALNSSSFAGGLIGFSAGGTISDCNSAVNISGSGAAIGGLIGYNGKRNVISNCYATGAITDTNSNRFDSSAGGLVGSNSGTIYDSYATGSIAATFNSSSAYVYIGGIVGDNTYGTICGSYATGNISITSNPSDAAISAGGLVGLNKSGDVNDCYSTGQITFDCSDGSKYMIGGVVGLNCGESINRCYSKCAIGSGVSDEADCSVGGVAGLNMEGVVSGCFWHIQTSGKTISGGGRGLTTEQMKTMLIYQNAGWAGNGWVMNDGVDYPRLEWENTVGVPIPEAGLIPLIGSGTEADPYQVWTAADFAYLSWYKSILDEHIVLMADIDLAGIRVCPIEAFTGSFDGNGHMARNIEIYEPTNCYVGVFRRVGTGGVITNFGIRDAKIVGGDCVGGLIGKNEGGAIGGCYSTGSIDGLSDTGGLIGRSDSGTVDNCYSTAAVTVWPYNNSVSYGGGLVGYVNFGTISKCYSAGSVSPSSSSYTGGLIGRAYYNASIATRSFWDKMTSGKTTSAGGTGAVGKTTAQMKTLSTFTSVGWDFLGETTNGTQDIWAIYSSYYPCLKWQVNIITPDVVAMTQADAENTIVAADLVVGSITSSYSGAVPDGCIISQSPAAGIAVQYGIPVNIVISLGSRYIGGAGTETNPYQIADINGLLALAATPAEYNKCFILKADINMAGQIFTTAIVAADTDSDSTFHGTAFTGTFDGNGHKITDFTINGTGNSYLGLFGRVNAGGLVKNLGIDYFSVSGSQYVGGLSGFNYGGSISNCYSTGTVNGSSFVGGLVGWNISGGDISNCYSTSLVSGSYYIGGFVGCNGSSNDSGSISNCYSTGSVSGSSNIGGLTGYNSGNLRECYATGVTSGSSNVGGLIGRMSSGSATTCFWDVNTTGQTMSTSGTGKTTVQMKMLSTFIDAGWDFIYETDNGFEDYWRMCVDGVNYPKLSWEFKAGDFGCPDGVDIYDLAVFVDQWLFEELSYDLYQDNQNIVNLLDFGVIANNWSGDDAQLAGFAAEWLQRDAGNADIAPAPDGDGVVNMLDFAVLAENWMIE
ncbi:MAG: PASTA domain-containing protein, partial [Phycisphaerae bacterium]